MAIKLLGGTDTPMGTQRSTIDGNFMQVEILSNKTDTITSGASSTLYLSEKAAYDYIQNQYYQSTTPTTKSGDSLILKDSAGKAKYKVNENGSLKEIILDRACGTYLTSAQFTALNSVYLEGEILIESDTKKEKRGDGVTAWNSLPYNSEFSDGGVSNQKWIKYPNGLIQQWGSTGITATSSGILDYIVTLPISFTVSTAMYLQAYILDSYSVVKASQSAVNKVRFTAIGLNANSIYDVRYNCIGY